MTAVPAAERMTAEEFLALPEPERGWPWSLIDGEVVVNDPTMLHGEVQGELYLTLANWARAAGGRGKVALPLDVGLDEHNVFKPDVVWYSERRLPARVDRPPYPMPASIKPIAIHSGLDPSNRATGQLVTVSTLPVANDELSDRRSEHLLKDPGGRSRPQLAAMDPAARRGRSAFLAPAYATSRRP